MGRPSPGLDITSSPLDGVDPDESPVKAEVVDQDAVVQVEVEVTGGQRVENITLVAIDLTLDNDLEGFNDLLSKIRDRYSEAIRLRKKRNYRRFKFL